MAKPHLKIYLSPQGRCAANPNAITIGLKHGPALPPGLNSGQQVTSSSTGKHFRIQTFARSMICRFLSAASRPNSSPAKHTSFIMARCLTPCAQPCRSPACLRQCGAAIKSFIDGGLVDNLPTDVVRAMGADIVIGVHLQISPASAKDIQSAFSILGRSVELIIAQTELRGMEGADLIVKADVEKYTTMDYAKYNELIKIGYDAAEQKAALLKGVFAG